ncbi:steroidogenic acute regulatory protein-like [Anoplophora glabripennis]|uniref:StAR-related lipid transfer protein n=1 Tax=Anoplophora glabripennis TaxID=217634 RepID=V5GWI2_ANOGL|nr:steroidogenic acute regulatory protein-like [Anoplophora glabripennis]
MQVILCLLNVRKTLNRKNMTNPHQESRSPTDYIVRSNSQQIENPQFGLDMSHSHSINTIPSLRDYIVSEDLLAGQRTNGRMSNVRRFFCLFVTFDLLFTSLMWIICVMLNGEFIITALSEQVIHYNIHTSLFDIVLAALCRFVVLLLFYALLYINHWIVISISTASTCGFLITKVFFYDWHISTQPVFEVLLVLASFILAWGEAWFLDFRVIPQELHANRFYITTTESERAPLIRSYVQGLPSVYTESVGNFYSPQGSPEGSLDRFEQSPILGAYPPVRFTRDQEEKYRLLAAKTLQDAWDLFQKKDWKLVKQNGLDFVFTSTDSKGAKIFRLQGQIDASPRLLLDELYFRIQDLAKWNSAIKESHKIQAIDEHTDITYNISADAARGLVTSRDFVNLRHWAYVEDCYVICNVKTEHPSLPVSKKFVRGENGVGCWIMETVRDNQNKCNFYWIVNTDLKLRIPGLIFTKEMSAMMFNYMKDLRQHILKKHETERYD